MIPITIYQGKKVAVFGLGGSGLATLKALVAGGAEVIAWDDNEAGRANAAELDGVEICDLNAIDWAGLEAFVLSPGVPLTHPEPHWTVKLAKAADVEIIGDIELFCRERRHLEIDAPFVAITGTNGKSTSTALICHLLDEAGHDVQMGGNIGTPILALDPIAQDKVYVIEVSSYQIDLAPSLNPTIGVMLNLSADHLDRHGDLQNYAQIKARLVAQSELAVVGLDDRLSANIANNVRVRGTPVVTISGFGNERAAVRAPDGFLQYKEQDFFFNLDQARALRGSHNAQNASAAVAVVSQFDLTPSQLAKSLMSFGGLEHRMEEVGHQDGILYINDSKATNADAAARALGAFRHIHWIVGGLPKEGGIDGLIDYFDRIEHAYLIGEASEGFSPILSERGVSFTSCGHLDAALAQAVATIKPKQASSDGAERVILLSPACASFDQFPNFMQRGDAFREGVHAFLETGQVPVASGHVIAGKGA